jgi:hypothetical protein
MPKRTLSGLDEVRAPESTNRFGITHLDARRGRACRFRTAT